jgi:thymidylate kinase
MPLQEVLRIFTILNQEQVRYCHWKSNAHLSRSFESDADFDLLIAARDADRFQLCMKKLKVKRRYSTANKVFPGMEDYLGFDETSGKLFHFHVHFKLVIGKKNQKNYHIPIEDLILNSAVCDEKYPIKVIRPELELMLLIIRSLIKVDFGLKMATNLILNRGVFPLNIRQEFAFLIMKVNRDVFFSYIRDLFPELLDVSRQIAQSEDLGRLSYFQVWRFNKRITKSLRAFRLFSNRELKRELKIKRLAFENSRSWFPAGGVSFAFIGADGSGKSSLVSHIKKWLGWKLSVQSAYMGLPKQRILWKILNIVTGIANRVKISFLKDQLDFLRWVFVAKLRYKIYRNSEMLKSQGKIVIFDRFPLKEFWDMDDPMDGPRLKGSTLWENIERKYYNEIKCPDYIFVLKVNEKESLERKKEHAEERNRQAIKRKITAVDKLAETKNNRFIIIDTLKGLEPTLLEVKKKLWELL